MAKKDDTDTQVDSPEVTVEAPPAPPVSDPVEETVEVDGKQRRIRRSVGVPPIEYTIEYLD